MYVDDSRCDVDEVNADSEAAGELSAYMLASAHHRKFMKGENAAMRAI